jgi:hypothetical protein
VAPGPHLPATEVVKSKSGQAAQAEQSFLTFRILRTSHGDRVMEARFIYRNRSDARFYDASAGEMRGGADKVIVYVNGVLCTMDRESKITIPVSRWKLVEIGLACFWAALKGKGAVPRSLESVPVPEPPPLLPEAADEHLLRSLDDDERVSPEATHQDSSEAEWERLIREMRDLSR